jgi:hypothetical protein
MKTRERQKPKEHANQRYCTATLPYAVLHIFYRCRVLCFLDLCLQPYLLFFLLLLLHVRLGKFRQRSCDIRDRSDGALPSVRSLRNRCLVACVHCLSRPCCRMGRGTVVVPTGSSDRNAAHGSQLVQTHRFVFRRRLRMRRRWPSKRRLLRLVLRLVLQSLSHLLVLWFSQMESKKARLWHRARVISRRTIELRHGTRVILLLLRKAGRWRHHWWWRAHKPTPVLLLRRRWNRVVWLWVCSWCFSK